MQESRRWQYSRIMKPSKHWRRSKRKRNKWLTNWWSIGINLPRFLSTRKKWIICSFVCNHTIVACYGLVMISCLLFSILYRPFPLLLCWKWGRNLKVPWAQFGEMSPLRSPRCHGVECFFFLLFCFFFEKIDLERDFLRNFAWKQFLRKLSWGMVFVIFLFFFYENVFERVFLYFECEIWAFCHRFVVPLGSGLIS